MGYTDSTEDAPVSQSGTGAPGYSGCLACGRGLYEECELDDCPCKVCNPDPAVEEIVESFKESKGDRFREFRDTKSTGRKRAALLYPFICDTCGHTKEQHGTSCTECSCSVFQRKSCQWRNSKNNGGGKYPTIGCSEGLQTDRHHGPIKDTMRNELGNVHLICSQCHQRYHYLNDPYYDEELALKDVHEPMSATAEEIARNDVDWISGAMKRKYNLGRVKVEAFD